MYVYIYICMYMYICMCIYIYVYHTFLRTFPKVANFFEVRRNVLKQHGRGSFLSSRSFQGFSSEKGLETGDHLVENRAPGENILVDLGVPLAQKNERPWSTLYPPTSKTLTCGASKSKPSRNCTPRERCNRTWLLVSSKSKHLTHQTTNQIRSWNHYCGWLRNPAPPKGFLKAYKWWDVYHLSTSAGFRNHQQFRKANRSRLSQTTCQAQGYPHGFHVYSTLPIPPMINWPPGNEMNRSKAHPLGEGETWIPWWTLRWSLWLCHHRP